LVKNDHDPRKLSVFAFYPHRRHWFESIRDCVDHPSIILLSEVDELTLEVTLFASAPVMNFPQIASYLSNLVFWTIDSEAVLIAKALGQTPNAGSNCDARHGQLAPPQGLSLQNETHATLQEQLVS